MPDSLFTSFGPSYCPEWLCPACLNPTMEMVKDSFNRGISAWTIRHYQELDPEQHQIVFSCLLRCAHTGCGETVAISGDGEVFQGCEDPEEGIVYIESYTARAFTPPLPLFAVPAGCPERVSGQLNEISSLLTGHFSSAANAIRSLVEMLIDDLGVPRTLERPDKEPRELRLNERLTRFEEMIGEHHAGMDALRLFGNAGSHGNPDITQQHLEDASVIVEQLVQQLYQRKADTSSQIDRLTEAFAKKPAAEKE